jgi:hypothetical protein
MWHGAQCYILQDECPTRKNKTKGFIHYPLGKLKIFALGSSIYSSSHGTWVHFLTVFNAIVQFSSMPSYLPYLGELLPRYQLPQIFIRYATSMNAIIPFEFSSIFTFSLHAFFTCKSPCLHLVFGPASTPTSPLSEVSAK